VAVLGVAVAQVPAMAGAAPRVAFGRAPGAAVADGERYWAFQHSTRSAGVALRNGVTHPATRIVFSRPLGAPGQANPPFEISTAPLR
jgi:hypothetical protein